MAIDLTHLGSNAVLASLTPATQGRLAAHGRLRDFAVRDHIYRRGGSIVEVVFPIGGVFSMVSEMDEQRAVEVAMVGYEGMLGLPVFLQTTRSSTLAAFCQVPGQAVTVPVDPFLRLTGESADLSRALHRFTMALLNQIAQAAACNGLHDLVQERAAAWLLKAHDRVRRDDFPLAREFLAQMLGVPLERVWEATAVLEEAGVIRYADEVVTVLDRAGLEAASCECYGVVADEDARLSRDA